MSFLIPAIGMKILLIPVKNNKIEIENLYWYNLLTYGISRFLPGRIGDASIIYFLKKEDIPIGIGTAIALIDKIIVFFVQTMFAVVGFFIFFSTEVALKLTIISFFIFVLAMFFITWEKGRLLIRKYILRKHSEKFSKFYLTFSNYFKKHILLLIANIILATVKTLFFGFLIYLAFIAVNVNPNINLITIMIIASVINIISIIPITIAGLGARESISVLLFNELGITPEVTISAFIILLFVRYVSSATLLLYYTWKKKH